MRVQYTLDNMPIGGQNYSKKKKKKSKINITENKLIPRQKKDSVQVEPSGLIIYQFKIYLI